MSFAELDRVLAYENDEVVQRFASDHSVSHDDAEEIFVETKRWLWLCAHEGGAVPMPSEARAIDLMWHTFLLFTKDYAEFCKTYFGTFLHHQPRTHSEKVAWQKRIADDGPAALAERRATLRKTYELIGDRFGQETLKKWCEDFPARFHV